MSSTSASTPGTPSRRFYELDSLRGMAALTVVFYHFTLICPPGVRHLFLHTPLRLFVAGHQAVILFFLLSGFVLTLPYAKRSSLSYGPFLLKRVCRIYLPYLGALALAVFCDYLFSRRHPFGSYWIDATWSVPITAKLIMQHILFLGYYSYGQFNTAFWSLVYEMRISLAFPFMALAVLRLRTRWSIIAALALSLSFVPLADLFSSTLHLCSHDAAFSSALTLHYAAFFVLGSLLAKNLQKVNAWYKRLHPLTALLLALVSLLLYCFADSNSITERFSIPVDLYDWGAAGAVMIMIFAMNAPPFHAFLTSRVIHHLGEVSYSLYLVHGTVLFTLIHLYLGRIHLSTFLVLYLTITLAVTEIFYRLIERPTMLLGRRLTASRPPKPTFAATI